MTRRGRGDEDSADDTGEVEQVTPEVCRILQRE